MDETLDQSSTFKPAPFGRATLSVPPDLLAQLQSLYDQGLHLDAYRLCLTIGPLDQWAGPAARILAGRLAANLGGMRLSQMLHLRAYRDAPEHPEATYYFARAILERKGPYQAWRFAQDTRLPPGAKINTQAEWLSFRACLAASLRDFGTAEQFMAQALALCDDHPWLWLDRSYVCQMADRHEDALAAALRALELRPWYRPGIQAAAQLLSTLNRDAQALSLLEDAVTRIQSGLVVAHLAVTCGENRNYSRARELWERVVELSPLADRDFKKYLAARRCDAAYDCGDIAAAAQFAKGADHEYYNKIAARLSEDLTGKQRVELDVPFVQQHHMTCAPATLSAISLYWKRPAEHLEIVEDICYDGTPSHSERKWAAQHGFIAREFRVTWESVVALVDRGIPFTLTTVDVTSAHLQAVIGYDARKGTIILRDPSFKYSNEALADLLLQRHASTGPRGMILVPSDEAHRLDGIDLPEADLYDLFHQMQAALVAHRRPEAADALRRLESAAPDHRLTHWARRSLAGYDADPVGLLRSTQALLVLYPDDAMLQLHRVGLLRNLASRSEILAALRQASEKPKSDVIFLQQYAQELGADPRELPRATRMLRRCLRDRPGEPSAYFILANLLWQTRDFDEALELYRFATSLNDKDDQFAGVYFNAARYFKQTEQALALMRERYDHYGGRSGGPAKTLFTALATVERVAEGFKLLDQAMIRRKDDTDLVLFAADACARYGYMDRAAQQIEFVRGRAHDSLYQRALASLANYRGQLAVALQRWQDVLAHEPQAADAHERVAQLLAETQGPDAALAHLRQACQRFEHNFPIYQLFINWLRADHLDELQQVLLKLLENRPADARLIREQIVCLVRLGRVNEAIVAADTAVSVDPSHSYSHSVAAYAYAAAGQIDRALQSARQALLLSIDNDDAMHQLLDLCADVNQRKEALAFISGELVRQVTFGDGLLAFASLAAHTLDGEQILGILTDALNARPDLWHAWSAKTRHLANMGRLDEACQVAAAAVVRFPLLPRLWLDLATAQGQNGNPSAEKESLHRALEIAPGSGPAVRHYADSRMRTGDYAGARKMLEDGITWAPLDPLNHGMLSEVLWHLGEKDHAIESVSQALRLAPGYEHAWVMLRQWAADIKKPGLATDLAREMTRHRGGEARTWYMLARVLGGPDALDEQLAALDHASRLEPLNIDYDDYRAYLLARADRFDDAQAACRPAAHKSPPLRLRGRWAWVLAQRGDLQAAIAELRQLVHDDPRYVWGWTTLAEWYRQAGHNDDFLAAARTLVALTPLDAVALCYLGDAHELRDEIPQARQAFERAYTLDPSHVPAGLAVFDLQLAAAEFDAAAATLDQVGRHDIGPAVLARWVRLNVLRDHNSAAIGNFTQLCAQPDVSLPLLTHATERSANAELDRAIDQILDKAIGKIDVPVPVAEFWVRRQLKQGQWESVEYRLDALRHSACQINPTQPPRDPDPIRRAITVFLELAGDLNSPALLLRFIATHESWLMADEVYWGTVGGSLVNLNQHARCVEWMAQWGERKDLAPWMLVNMCLACRTLGLDAQAADVTQAALRLPADQSTPTLRLWHALDLAWTGNDAQAQIQAGLAAPHASGGYLEFLNLLASALLIPVSGSSPWPVLADARKLILDAKRRIKSLRKSPALWHAYVRTIRHIARRRGGWRSLLFRFTLWLRS